MTLAGSAIVLALLTSAPLSDPEAEARAQDLMREIRCVACENEPVSQSAAPIAEDMRARIREMVAEGSTNGEVRDWFEARYGAHALFRPPARGFGGTLLWLLPFAFLAVGGVVAMFVRGRRNAREITPVAADHDAGTQP
ncbi:MAG: cytochrome c-type biogenesis protein [Pseudomonadota bacterium]